MPNYKKGCHTQLYSILKSNDVELGLSATNDNHVLQTSFEAFFRSTNKTVTNNFSNSYGSANQAETVH